MFRYLLILSVLFLSGCIQEVPKKEIDPNQKHQIVVTTLFIYKPDNNLIKEFIIECVVGSRADCDVQTRKNYAETYEFPQYYSCTIDNKLYKRRYYLSEYTCKITVTLKE